MNQWELIRLRCARDGEPIKRVARELGLAPNTVRKYVRAITVPTKINIDRPCRLDRLQPVIDEYLGTTPKITARRIGDLLREHHDPQLQIGERALRQYVARRRKRLVPREAFVRAVYAPGDQAQFDFSPMRAMVGGVERIVQAFIMRLSHSTAFFSRASYRQDQPALFAGLLDAVQFFDGLPKVAVFDNAKTAVTKVQRGRERVENTEFAAFRGALALAVEYAAPRRGNEKGGVEGAVGYVEDNFFRPMPSFADLDELNSALLKFCQAQLRRKHPTLGEPVGDILARERHLMRALPEMLPKACTTQYARVNKFAEVTVERNRYSVPTTYAYRDATVEIYDGRIIILVDGERIADHHRAAGKDQAVIDPLHYIDLISRKHRSATRALAFADQRLPEPLIRLRDRLLEEHGTTATKTWTAVLRLALESSLDALAHATEIALARGTLDPQAIALLLRQRADTTALVDIARSIPARYAQTIDLSEYHLAALVERAS
ncbi:MAG: IS21 family transposase [Candidatus Tyrphobacter sp.]